MRSWTPYLSKESRQSRRLALAALGVFLGISFIPSIIESCTHARVHWYNGNTLGVLFLGGPLLAIVAGVYATGREQGAIEAFWRSRPVNLNRWLVSKYIMGLALVWLVCWGPLSIHVLGEGLNSHWMDDDVFESLNMSIAYSFILLLIYSTSFVLGQCIRGVLHASILAVGVTALIYIMPLATAPLNWLSVEVLQKADVGVLDLSSLIAFAATMTALSVASLALAGILLKRNVQIEVDQRALGWSVAVILLVLTAGIAFPMGTNLSPQQVIPLPITQEGVVRDMAAHGNEVLLLLSSGPAWKGSKLGLVRVHIGEQTSVVDEPFWFLDPGQEQSIYFNSLDLVWPVEDPACVYVVVSQNMRENKTLKEPTSTLYTVALDAKQADPVVHRIALNPLVTTRYSAQTACLHRQRLYVYSNEHQQEGLLTFSLADPRAPSLIHSEHLAHHIGWLHRGPSQDYQLCLPPIPDTDDSARLEITYKLAAWLWSPAGDSRLLASNLRSGSFAPRLALYETGPTQNDLMPLHPIAQRRSATFEGLIGSPYGELFYSAPLAYRLGGSGVTVYHIGSSRQIERVGHYAAEGGFSRMVALPNHRVVLAGRKLHVLDLSDKVAP